MKYHAECLITNFYLLLDCKLTGGSGGGCDYFFYSWILNTKYIVGMQIFVVHMNEGRHLKY